jgi:hypothetical protein
MSSFAGALLPRRYHRLVDVRQVIEGFAGHLSLFGPALRLVAAFAPHVLGIDCASAFGTAAGFEL